MSDYAIVLSARMSSTRLSGKALCCYCPDGTSNLAQIVARWRTSRRSPAVIVATSEAPEDRAIAIECENIGVPYWRGSQTDVVRRMDEALHQHAPDSLWVARALADNPLVDVALADWRFDRMVDTGTDGLWYGGDEARLTYAATTDIWSRAAWDRIARDSKGDEREHPGLFFWRNIERFRAVELTLPGREYLLPIRTELDTDADLDVMRAAWREWGRPEVLPTVLALEWLERHPEVTALNADVPTKTQTKPEFKRGTHWLCANCRHIMGRVGSDGEAHGDLVVRCGRCGFSKKFFENQPRKARPAYIRR